MRKQMGVAVQILVAGIMLSGNAMAQQTSVSPAKKAPAANASGAAKAPSAAKTDSGLVTKKDKVSYAIGINFGKGLKGQPIDVDPGIVAQAVKDGLTGGKLAMTDDEVKTVLTELQGELQKGQEAKMAQQGEANKKEGAAFLAANKPKEGVVTLPSGLQYKIVKQGTGPKPAATDTVVCNYRGTLINGTEFDSSYKRGQPAQFPVGGVIRGWTEALQLMPVGSKWDLYLPADLAYGDRGAGPDIGPGSTLVFEVELLSIQGKK